MSAKIIIGDLSGVEKKGFEMALADEAWIANKGEEWIRETYDHQIPPEAVCTAKHYGDLNYTDYTFVWYEITL